MYTNTPTSHSTQTIGFNQLLANDTDVDNPASDLTVSAVRNANNGTATIVGGQVTFTPTDNFNGTASFEYQVDDQHGGTAWATAFVTVAPPPNLYPSINVTYSNFYPSGSTPAAAFDIGDLRWSIADDGNTGLVSVTYLSGNYHVFGDPGPATSSIPWNIFNTTQTSWYIDVPRSSALDSFDTTWRVVDDRGLANTWHFGYTAGSGYRSTMDFTGWAPPVVLALDGASPHYIETQHSNVRFDLNGDGVADQVAWAAPGSGVLGIDLNGVNATTKTNDVAGDGTTTATVLAQAMVREGLRQVAAGASPLDVKRGIEKAVAAVSARLLENAREVNGKEEIADVATISSQDREIGELISDAFDKVGKDGVISVEESNTTSLELEFTEGMQFDKGFISAYFVTDPDRMETVLEDARILLVQGKVSSVQELLPLLEKVVQAGKPLLIVAEDVDGEALSTLVVNRIRGTFASCAVKAPAFGDRRKAILQDLALLTGAQVVSAEVGLKLDQVGLEVLGSARRVVVTKDNTTIVDGGGDPAEVDARVAQIRAEIERSDSDWDKEKLQERLAKIAGGVVVIKVGGHTEVELKEKKHRIEDAVSATRAAIEEGIVSGGGTALVQAAVALEGDLGLTGDQATGVGIVRRSLAEPLRWIAENAGEQGYVVVSKVAELPAGHGLNAATGEYVDLMAAGVIDPVKVTRSALQNAASIAAMLLTTEALVVEKKEDQSDEGNGHGHGHHGHSH